jgi:mannitol-1-phosphate 5-dehydrogenase
MSGSDSARDELLFFCGRHPLRKLTRFECLIGPAALLAELGEEPSALLEVVAASLEFSSQNDPEVEL